MLSGQALDDLDDLIAAVALGTAILDEVPHPLDNCALLRSSGNRDSSTSLEIEEPFLSKDVEGTKHRVLVHAEESSHVLGQGKPFTWAASPSAMARRISTATWSCSGAVSFRSTLTSNMVLGIVALYVRECETTGDTDC